MNRYKFMKAKEPAKPPKPKVGQVWRKMEGGRLFIRLDRRLVPSHNVVIWDASFNVWGADTKTQISEETLLAQYKISEEK